MSHWSYENGRLFARNEDGDVEGTWAVDKGLGQPLADLLNQSLELSDELLKKAATKPPNK